MNLRPSAYETDELPDCSTPQSPYRESNSARPLTRRLLDLRAVRAFVPTNRAIKGFGGEPWSRTKCACRPSREAPYRTEKLGSDAFGIQIRCLARVHPSCSPKYSWQDSNLRELRLEGGCLSSRLQERKSQEHPSCKAENLFRDGFSISAALPLSDFPIDRT